MIFSRHQIRYQWNNSWQFFVIYYLFLKSKPKVSFGIRISLENPVYHNRKRIRKTNSLHEILDRPWNCFYTVFYSYRIFLLSLNTWNLSDGICFYILLSFFITIRPIYWIVIEYRSLVWIVWMYLLKFKSLKDIETEIENIPK